MWVVEVNVEWPSLHGVRPGRQRARKAARGMQDRMTRLRNRVTH